MLSTCIKLPSVFMILNFPIFKWPLKTGFTVNAYCMTISINPLQSSLVCGHEEHSSGEVRTACDIQVGGRLGPGRPKITWKKLTENDCHELEWKLTTADPKERSTWRSGVKSAMCAACQLTGRRRPMHLQVNQKSDYDIFWMPVNRYFSKQATCSI